MWALTVSQGPQSWLSGRLDSVLYMLREQAQQFNYLFTEVFRKFQSLFRNNKIQLFSSLMEIHLSETCTETFKDERVGSLQFLQNNSEWVGEEQCLGTIDHGLLVIGLTNAHTGFTLLPSHLLCAQHMQVIATVKINWNNTCKEFSIFAR